MNYLINAVRILALYFLGVIDAPYICIKAYLMFREDFADPRMVETYLREATTLWIGAFEGILWYTAFEAIYQVAKALIKMNRPVTARS